MAERQIQYGVETPFNENESSPFVIRVFDTKPELGSVPGGYIYALKVEPFTMPEPNELEGKPVYMPFLVMFDPQDRIWRNANESGLILEAFTSWFSQHGFFHHLTEGNWLYFSFRNTEMAKSLN